MKKESKHSVEAREKMSKAHKGVKLSEEHRKKMSEGKKGNTNGFQKGQISPRKGKKCSKETREKMSLARKDIIFSDEHRKKLSEVLKGHRSWNKGLKHSKESKKKMSLAQMGKKLSDKTKEKIIKFRTGKKHSEESKKKMSEAQLGEKSHMWKGGVSRLPYSVDWTMTLKISIRERDKYICKICGEKQGDIVHHVHHIDYDKKNCNSDNLILLCRLCHMKTNFKRKYWVNYFNTMLDVK